jgi:ribosomal protein S18 acetylase RimI-like enzyme
MKLMPEEIKIRLATLVDINLLSALGATTFYEAYFEQDNSKNLAAYVIEAFNIQQMKNEIEDINSTFFVAELNGNAVGYAKLREGATTESVENERGIEINRIYILEKVQGKKVGLVLIQKCFETAIERGYEIIWLGVWEENIKAQKFYAKLGFEKVGKLFFEYGDEVGTNFVLKRRL